MKIGEGFAVELEHRIAASPDEVFDYFVDADKFKKWQGVEVELDPRPGGSFNVSTTPGVWTRGTYIEVERPRRIAVTWGFESQGPPLPRGLAEVPVASSTFEVTLAPDGEEGTILSVRHTGLPSDHARWAHEQGWRHYLSRLTIVCSGGDPGEDPVMELAEALFAHDAEDPPKN